MKTAESSPATIDEYIQSHPENVRALLAGLRDVIRKAAPDASERISYRIPTFYYNGNLVHFAAFQSHIGFYPGPSGISEFQNEFKQFKSAKGSVQFPITEPLPLKLVARVVKFRMTENAQKKSRPKSLKARPKSEGSAKRGTPAGSSQARSS